MIPEAVKYYEEHQYEKVIELYTAEDVNPSSVEEGLLLCRSHLAQGDFKGALMCAKTLLTRGFKDQTIISIIESYESHVETLDAGIHQIEEGKHSSTEINFLKESTSKLIENKAFIAAITQLRKLAEARKAKTTNIIWIGQFLKDIYFEEDAKNVHDYFDEKFLLDEILFYYLKACKLFEPGYKVVQDHAKAIKAATAASA